MPRTCEYEKGCSSQVRGTDKNTGLGYCGFHQWCRTDNNPVNKPRSPIVRKTYIKRVGIKKKRFKSQVDSAMGIPGLVKIADKVFGDHVKSAAANEKGLIKCFTCDNEFLITDKTEDGKKSLIQLGHFVSRACYFLRWSENNCRPQCVYCNEHKKGNLKVFAKRLGEEMVEWLNSKKREPFKLERGFVLNIINVFRKR